MEMLLDRQAMDLRWGIREQSHDDHTIVEFCMREIENCKRASVGPTFVVSSTPVVPTVTDPEGWGLRGMHPLHQHTAVFAREKYCQSLALCSANCYNQKRVLTQNA